VITGESDILIVGAGPAGCAAGIEAARAGANVCVVDRAEFPRPKTCGDAVSNDAARLVAELGVDLESIATATVRGAAAIFPDGNRVSRSYGAQPGFIAPRLDLDNALRLGLEASGAELRQGVNIRQLVKTPEGRVSGAEGDQFKWSAKLVIAADGPGSVAWTALRATKTPRLGMGLAVTEYYEGLLPAVEPDHSEHYFEAEIPNGYGWIFPAVDGVANVGVYQRKDRYAGGRGQLGKMLDEFIARHPERFDGAKRIGKRRSWALPLATYRRPLAGNGVLACGDAGRLIDPLTGEGIYQALHSGRLAGQSAVAALSGEGENEPEAEAAAMRRYRRRCAREITWPSASRVIVQEAMRWIVALRLYRSRIVRAILRWGYAGGVSEVTKSVES
jgi:menaquinone-9 beta-reductase